MKEPILRDVRAMAAEAEIEAFLARFRAFGAAPSAATYLPLFDPKATLFDSGMSAPIRVPEIPEHIEGILRLVPDFRMVPERWREAGGTLFVEAANSATLAGALHRWDSVYCVDLHGSRVIRGRRYYDRRPLFAKLNPELPGLPVGALGSRTPASVEKALAALLPGARREAVAAAGDAALSFAEWRITAEIGGAPFEMGGVDRCAEDELTYFDTLALATRLAEARA